MRFRTRHGGFVIFTRDKVFLSYRGIDLIYRFGNANTIISWLRCFKGVRAFMALVDHYYAFGITDPEYIFGLITDKLDKLHREKVLAGERKGMITDSSNKTRHVQRPQRTL